MWAKMRVVRDSPDHSTVAREAIDQGCIWSRSWCVGKGRYVEQNDEFFGGVSELDHVCP